MSADGSRSDRVTAGPSKEPPQTPGQIISWVDQAIQRAQRRGDFDNLHGAGEPLRSLDQPGDPDWWLKDLIKREKLDLAAALPGPMALRRERETYPESLLHLPDEAAAREALEDFNARVIADRKRPYAGQGSPAVVGRVDVEAMLTRWQVARAEADRERHAVQPGHGATEHEEAHQRTGHGMPPAPRRRWWRRRAGSWPPEGPRTSR